MFTRSSAMETAIYERRIPSREDADVQPNRSLGLVGLAVWVSLCLTFLILSVVAVARRETAPLILDPPQLYLPGNPFPKDASCDVPGDKQVFCSVKWLKQEIDFVFNEETRMIWRTVIPTREYTLGQLIASWGTPTSITRNDYTTYVYWGTRSVLLYTTSFQPDSRVNFIVYDLEQPETSPWCGFTRGKH